MTKTGGRDRKVVTDSSLRTQDCWGHQAPAERQGICTLLPPAGPIHSLRPRGLSYRFHPSQPTQPGVGATSHLHRGMPSQVIRYRWRTQVIGAPFYTAGPFHSRNGRRHDHSKGSLLLLFILIYTCPPAHQKNKPVTKRS